VTGDSGRGLFLRSAAAAGLSQGLRMVVTFAAMLVLRRTVPAADWGLFAWAWVVFMILGALRDLGLAYHAMRLSPRPWGNVLRLELYWGGALSLLVLLGAPAIAAWQVDPHPALVGVVRVFALYLFFEGLAAVPRFYFDAEQQVGRTLGPELLRNLLFVAVALPLSFAGHGIWSLAIAHVAAAASYAAALWIRAWPEIPLLHQPGRTLELLRGSLPLAAIWLLLILTRWLDPLVLGLRFPLEIVGNFSFALEWATLALAQILVPALGRALYPALVACADDGEALFRVFGTTTVAVMALEVPLAFFLALNAEWVVLLVGGGQWTLAPSFLALLALAPLVDPFGLFGGELLKARHLDRMWILSGGVTVLAFAAGGYLLTGWLGPLGMALVHFLPLGAIPMAWGLWRVAPAPFVRLARDLAFVYLAALPGFALVHFFADAGSPWRVFWSLAAALLALGLSAWRFGGELRRFFRADAVA
jgi:O-antigen/teichoic acid export membrane protein